MSNWVRVTLRKAAQRELEQAGEAVPFRPPPAKRKR